MAGNPNIVEAGKGTQFKPGQSGNLEGKPKGIKHISTHIQEMLNDEEFEAILLDSKKGVIDYKGAPIKAIIAVAISKALHDKDKGQQWAEWLAKHGYGTKITVSTEDPIEELLRAYGIKGGDDDGKAIEAVPRPSSNKT